MRAVVCLLFLVAAIGHAADVRVDATCPWEDKDGYTPVIVRLEALIAPVEVALEAALGEARASDRVRVEPGRPVTRTVLLPSNPGYGSPVLRWSSPGGGDNFGVATSIGYRAVALAVLDPREEVALPALQKLVEARAPDGGRQGRGGYHSSGGERVRRIPADHLPDRWQGLPAWLTLLTTPAGEAQLDAGQREAIVAWTRCGGRLFTSDRASQAAWQRLGALATVLDPAGEDQPALIERLRQVTGEDGEPAEHPVPGTDRLPTAWFLSLAIAFAIVAGPLNLWWVVRRRRQPWLMLLTTPLISLGTCALLIVIALVSEGLGRKRSAAQITLLDLTAQRAAIFTATTWFCGIAPGTFPLDPEDRLVPMDQADWRSGYRNQRPALALDWHGGQRALAGWIPARINRQLACTQQRPERRRLTLVRHGDAWRLGNGFDVAITEAHWRDAAGMAWSVRDLAPGQEATMTPAPAGPLDLHQASRRLALDARLALAEAATAPGWWTARLAAPLQPLPGPDAEDVEPVQAWAAGRLPPEGTP